MTLLGKGAVTIWNDITRGGRDVFYRWHDEEHMPERVGIEGFLRGRRWIRVDAETEIEWFTLYETVDPAVLTGSGYLDRLNDPTAWTREAVTHFLNVTRGLTEVTLSRSHADGGHLLAAAWSGEGAVEAAAGLAPVLAERMTALAGVCGVHVCVGDHAASSAETEERRAKGSANEIPDLVVMVETGRAAALVEARVVLADAARSLRRLEPLRQPGLYRLEVQHLPPRSVPEATLMHAEG
ncbi:MAG: hypothetical protein KDE35_06825 [Geminicoccaceae bacterium]|nr:hypothetical protein [Geminicoccaceae bacterium]